MELTYTYDDYHNVKTATTAGGLVYRIDYEAYGNNTSVSVRDGTLSVSGTATYTADGNRLSTVTDAAGNTTTYNYTENTNVLTWVKYPNDTEETRTRYTYTDQYGAMDDLAYGNGDSIPYEVNRQRQATKVTQWRYNAACASTIVEGKDIEMINN